MSIVKIHPSKMLVVVREAFTANYTQGKLYHDGKFICHTLEDRTRPEGVKVAKLTAIRAGVYPLRVSMSNRFKRAMPEILDVPQFTGIRIHGGNTPQIRRDVF